MNSHGQLFRITTFGESHGEALGVVIDGCPSGFLVDLDNIRAELTRRKPGQSDITTQRKEDDENFEVLSGLFEGKTTGHPITIMVRNANQKSKDYSNIKDLFRPNHADLTYHLKYGIRDYRGGGRSSGRETLSRVIAGAIAKQFLREKLGIKIIAYTQKIAEYEVKNRDFDYIEQNKLRTADRGAYEKMIEYVENARNEGNTVGGIIECIAQNVPCGLGEPVFDKIKSRLANSMLSIGGVLGFEYGAGFGVTQITGKTYNEGFMNVDGKICSENNKYGGILGGITTGEDIVFRVAVKPTSSIYSAQKTVDIHGNAVDFSITGRHDPCILPRVVPVIEAMTAIDLMDLYLLDRSRR
ncbi:MAG: chorismate synthase [Candidatus Gracilibacteria bacterium]|nr:chorismate synthase [Candidatus Gracilibacteria bacterium]